MMYDHKRDYEIIASSQDNPGMVIIYAFGVITVVSICLIYWAF